MRFTPQTSCQSNKQHLTYCISYLSIVVEIGGPTQWKMAKVTQFLSFLLIIILFLSNYSPINSEEPNSSISPSKSNQTTTTSKTTWNNNLIWPGDEFRTLPVVFTGLRQNKSSQTVRKENSRFLNIFSIIDIPNTACQSSQKPLRELNGTCYHPKQCAKLGGLGNGKCADGFGVCCFCTNDQNYFVNVWVVSPTRRRTGIEK